MRILRHFALAMIAGTALLHAASLKEVKQLRMDGKLDAAQTMVQEMLANEPESAQAHYELGKILIDRKDFAGAEREFAQVEAMGASDLALTGQGHVRVAQEKGAEAKEFFNRAQEQTPPAQELLDRVAAADSEENKASAKADAARLAELYYGRGLANALVRDYSASAADLETSIKLDPENAKAYYYAGLAYNALKRPDMMVSHFQTYLTMEPEGPESARVRSVLRGVR